jgi:hypothetical protein
MLLNIGQVNVQQGKSFTTYTECLVRLLYAMQEVMGDTLSSALQELLLLSYEALCSASSGQMLLVGWDSRRLTLPRCFPLPGCCWC